MPLTTLAVVYEFRRGVETLEALREIHLAAAMSTTLPNSTPFQPGAKAAWSTLTTNHRAARLKRTRPSLGGTLHSHPRFRHNSAISSRSSCPASRLNHCPVRHSVCCSLDASYQHPLLLDRSDRISTDSCTSGLALWNAGVFYAASIL